jgi:hypothetical protein
MKTVYRAIDGGCKPSFHVVLEALLSDTRTPRPRSREDTHPSRISNVRNVTTPMGVWSRGREDTLQASKPTATAANPPAGQDDPRSEGRHAERHGEDITRRIGPGNRRYPPRKGADVGIGEPPAERGDDCK